MSRSLVRLVASLSLLAACSDSEPHAGDEQHAEPGTPLAALSLSAADQAALGKLEQELAPLQALSADALLAKRVVATGALDFDPLKAVNLPLLQDSALALRDNELAKLGRQGFVIAPRQKFSNFASGYRTIYMLDLPVYVSLDAILETVHLSYDSILKNVEQSFLIGELTTLLRDARTRLPAVADEQARRDLDLYFAVALSLLDDVTAAPVAGADAEEIAKLVSKARAESGIIKVDLFGVLRDVDFSQFKPRGHYEDSEDLKKYFRATMWLGRTDFRLIERMPDGTHVFRRRQLQAALGLRDVVQGAGRAAFDQVDKVVSAFVGEHDYMELRQLDALVADLGDLSARDDQAIAQTIIEKGYGAQRIASQVIFKSAGSTGQTVPLGRSFALLGQRYTVDSHVFSNVVYDRVLHDGFPHRYLPNPLDAAYAAIGNDTALPLLKSELTQYAYAPELERMRLLIDAHGDGYWGENLYNLWLSSLRAASPTPAASTHGLSSVMGSDAWQRRVLNTQLASWAELRHDTILYVKQSYTDGIACEFPDGYVDPYPEAFERLRLYALKGAETVALLPSTNDLGTRIKAYFDELATVSTMLRDMAMQERTGTPFDAAQMAFLNDAVKTNGGVCGGPETYTGWYARLLFDKSDEDMEPTIADVHTDPGGNRPAKVLHVGTGLPRLMVVTANTCEGPRAYVGVASAYHEVITGLDRLTDSTWAPMANTAADVPWMTPILP
ncbi:MAG: DUF3160 domain-containing protein [Polyangiales bacterium]